MATNKTSTSGRATKKSSSANGDGQATRSRSSASRQRAGAPRAAAPRTMNGAAVAAEASRQLLQLTGRAAEGVTGLERTDDGWKVQVEVVEVRRIPDTTDVLAVYEIDVDSDGDLEGYRRLRRYTRGVAREE